MQPGFAAQSSLAGHAVPPAQQRQLEQDYRVDTELAGVALEAGGQAEDEGEVDGPGHSPQQVVRAGLLLQGQRVQELRRNVFWPNIR